jgi:hypothetical protein
MKDNTRNKSVADQAERTSLLGVKDGVAGSWISPNYLEVKHIDYVAGNRQHFENVTRQLHRSVEAYKQELKTSHG